EAFEVMTLDAASMAQLHGQARERGVTPEIVETVKRNAEAIATARRAAKAPMADWGLEVEQGPMAEMPWLADTRRLAMLLEVAARVAAHEGRSEEAVDLLLANLALARHVGATPV